MNIGVIAAKVGDKVIVVFAVILMVLLMSYGSFSLWYTYMTMQEGFLNNELMALKPFADKDGSLSFQDLLMINEDVRAWITIDDTHIFPFRFHFYELPEQARFFRPLYPDIRTPHG